MRISQKSCENSTFLRFLAKNRFLLIFMNVFNTPKSARARWLYDVIVTSYEVQWYSFWYQWIEEVHTYTLVANIGVSSVPYRKSREGVATTLPFVGRVTKNTSGGRGLRILDWSGTRIGLLYECNIWCAL